MRITELVLAALFFIALLMYLFLIPGYAILLILSMASLSCMYFYFGFALFNGIRLRKIFKKESYLGVSTWRIVGAVCTGIALSLLLMGILFKLLRWPGAAINLLAAFCLVPIVIISIVRYFKNHSVFYLRIFKRLAVFVSLGLFLFFTPQSAIVDFRYRNYPAYKEALKNSMAHPDDEALRAKADVERDKMYEEQNK